ncbi:hypothetical protein AB6A40_004087 [Gnathostoma spinigerum]|uniref:CHK kinase-like domain-containing protein n=1 Tax=Gnathostoma spinigerum TaxID=75299 RepID=A0ABD6EBF6_9BILA
MGTVRNAELVDDNLLKRKIGESTFSVKWLLDALRDNDNEWKATVAGQRVSKVDTRDISEGKGLASWIYRVKITVEPSHKSYGVILKVPHMKKLRAATNAAKEGSKDEEEASEIMNAREIEFYTKHARSGLPLPKIYAVKEVTHSQEGAILMEDVGKDTAMMDREQLMTYEQIVALIRCLAQLHAYSLSLPEGYLKEIKVPKVSANLYYNMIRQNAPLTAKLDERYMKLYEQVKNVFDSSEFVEYSLNGIHLDLGIPAVLVHGDIHQLNIFWNALPDGTCGSKVKAIIDWQAMHAGNIGQDLARLMIIAMTSEQRRDREKEILDVYRQTLLQEAAKYNVDIKFGEKEVGASVTSTNYTMNIVAYLFSLQSNYANKL